MPPRRYNRQEAKQLGKPAERRFFQQEGERLRAPAGVAVQLDTHEAAAGTVKLPTGHYSNEVRYK